MQEALAPRVRLQDELGVVSTIAGVDCGFEQGGTVTRAAVVLMSWPGLVTLDSALARRPTTFPYVPGYLSFRELPAVLAALDQLASTPDLLLCDGQGLAHPRRFGIACHLGVLLDLPAIGVGKSRLLGTHREPGRRRGCSTLLKDGADTMGRVVRTRDGVKPLFVSPGHRISVPTAQRWVLRTARRYRLPEPIRAADRLASNRA